MKAPLSLLAVGIAAVICVGIASTGPASAAKSHQRATTTLNIVMHDPGCHWFKIGGKFTKRATAAGPVRLANYDEATLKVSSQGGLRHIPVNKSIVVGHGSYTITMVHQAVDDNHLKLTVR